MVSVFLQDDNIKIRVPFGTNMKEVALKSGASMEFGCRAGECTICAVRVLSGKKLLSANTDKELRALEIIGSDLSDIRLMCQSRVMSDEGEIVISYGR